MAEESGRLLGKQLTVCRAEVINRLWELAQLPPSETNNTIGGQIKAAETLALVFDIKVNRPADLDRELQGKTSAEIDFFVEHGYFPDPLTLLTPLIPRPLQAHQLLPSLPNGNPTNNET